MYKFREPSEDFLCDECDEYLDEDELICPNCGNHPIWAECKICGKPIIRGIGHKPDVVCTECYIKQITPGNVASFGKNQLDSIEDIARHNPNGFLIWYYASQLPDILFKKFEEDVKNGNIDYDVLRDYVEGCQAEDDFIDYVMEHRE